MKKIAMLTGALLFFVACNQAEEQTPIVDLNTIKSLPQLPFLTKGCEGECCGILKTNKALLEIQLQESPAKSSKKVGTIKKNESFDGAEFFTKVLKFGEVNEGEKKWIVVTYVSEGYSAIWDGQKMRVTESEEGYKAPQTESWVQIKTKSGLKGWANIPPKLSNILDYGWCG